MTDSFSLNVEGTFLFQGAVYQGKFLFQISEFGRFPQQSPSTKDNPETSGESTKAAARPEICRVESLLGKQNLLIDLFRKLNSDPPVFVNERDSDQDKMLIPTLSS